MLVKCAKCGNEFDSLYGVCPYCGTEYVPPEISAVSAQFVTQQKQSPSVTGGKKTKTIVLVSCILLAVTAVTAAVLLILFSQKKPSQEMQSSSVSVLSAEEKNVSGMSSVSETSTLSRTETSENQTVSDTSPDGASSEGSVRTEESSQQETTSVSSEPASSAESSLVSQVSHEPTIEDYQKAIAENPQDPALYLKLAEVYEAAGDRTHALKTLKEGYEQTKDQTLAEKAAAYGEPIQESSQVQESSQETSSADTDSFMISQSGLMVQAMEQYYYLEPTIVNGRGERYLYCGGADGRSEKTTVFSQENIASAIYSTGDKLLFSSYTFMYAYDIPSKQVLTIDGGRMCGCSDDGRYIFYQGGQSDRELRRLEIRTLQSKQICDDGSYLTTHGEDVFYTRTVYGTPSSTYYLCRYDQKTGQITEYDISSFMADVHTPDPSMDFVGGLVRHGNRIYFLVENIAGTGSFVQGAEIVEMGLDGADASAVKLPETSSKYFMGFIDGVIYMSDGIYDINTRTFTKLSITIHYMDTERLIYAQYTGNPKNGSEFFVSRVDFSSPVKLFSTIEFGTAENVRFLDCDICGSKEFFTMAHVDYSGAGWRGTETDYFHLLFDIA